MNPERPLSRRERQMMDIIFRMGRASAADVRKALPDPPSYSAVRATLRVLEEKGHLRHELEGQRFLFLPTVTLRNAKRSALQHVLRTFFDGSVEQVVATLLDVSQEELSDDELKRLSIMVENAAKEGM